MKTSIIVTGALTPGAAGVGTISFASVVGFDVRRLVAVINLDRSEAILYAPADPYGYTSVSGTTVTLGVSSIGHNSADRLLVLYDDPAADVRVDYDDGSGVPVRVTPAVGLPTTGHTPAATTGTISGNGSVTATLNGDSAVAVALSAVSGTFSTTMTLQGSDDGTTWYTLVGQYFFGSTLNTFTSSNTSISIGGFNQSSLPARFLAPTQGYRFVRVNTSSWSGTGSMSARIQPVPYMPNYTQAAVGIGTNNTANAANIGSVALVGSFGGGQSTTLTTLSHSILAAAGTNPTVVKGSMAMLRGGWVHNLRASPVYLKLFNKASSPTVGTDTPVYQIPLSAGYCGPLPDLIYGSQFSSGLGYAITAGQPLLDATGVTAGDLSGVLFLH